jgi:hypothetical protein
MSRKILLPVVIATLLVLGACKKVGEQAVVAQNPYPESSPLHAPFDRVLRKFADDPRYMARFKHLDRSERQRAALELSRSGTARLDHATLEQRLDLLAALIENVDVPHCALSVRGDPNNGAAMLKGLEKLPPPQIERWFSISMKAIDAELNKTPPQPVAPAQVQAAMESLVRSLPEDQQQRLVRILPQITKASDDDACWAVRTMYRQALTMAEPVRGQLAWVFAQP